MRLFFLMALAVGAWGADPDLTGGGDLPMRAAWGGRVDSGWGKWILLGYWGRRSMFWWGSGFLMRPGYRRRRVAGIRFFLRRRRLRPRIEACGFSF